MLILMNSNNIQNKRFVALIALCATGFVIMQMGIADELRSERFFSESDGKSYPVQLGTNADGAIVTIRLSREASNDRVLSQLCRMPSLRKITIKDAVHSSGLTTNGLDMLGKLPALTNVSLECFATLPQGLLRSVSRLPHIRNLTVIATHVEEIELVELENSQIKDLTLETCTNVTNEVVQKMRQVKHLERLKLFSTGVTKDVRAHLDKFKNIKQFDLTERLIR